MLYFRRPAGAVGRSRNVGLILAAGLVLSGCTSTGPTEASATSSTSTGSTSVQSQPATPSAGTSDPSPSDADAPSTGSSAGADSASVMSWPASLPDLVEQLQPSVVTILTPTGSGSGVVYTSDGLVLTNEHVVRGSTRVQVAFADGQQVAGRVTATDAISDLALIQSERTDVPAVQFETRLPRVGEPAVVIGSPLGFESSVTAGIISGLHRGIPGSASSSQSLVDLIQTDAAISPGNSGGALINAAGKVIGISEAYIPPQSGAVSLGFAIPAATAVRVAEQLREDGTAEHAFIGLAPATITPQIARQLGRPGSQGVVVLSVVPDGPAAAAGVLPGDILLTLDGAELTVAEDLLAALRRHRPGDVVEAGIDRSGQRLDVHITVADRPSG